MKVFLVFTAFGDVNNFGFSVELHIIMFVSAKISFQRSRSFSCARTAYVLILTSRNSDFSLGEHFSKCFATFATFVMGYGNL